MRNILWRYQSKDWKWPWLVGFERFERWRPLWPLWGICYTSCLPKFGHQTLNCAPIRYIIPAKIFPPFPLCQKNWFFRKEHLGDFYPLLRSKSSSWIHIGVKRISQACCLHHLKNMEKKIVKRNFGMKNKIERFFWTTLQLKNMRPIFIKIVKYKVCLNKSWAISFTNIGFLAWILWKYIRSK